MSKEATKLALEALMHEMKYVLCCINLDIVPFDGDDFHEALRLGEEALVKQEQGSTTCDKPVAWWVPKAEQFCLQDPSGERPFAKAWEPLYTTPQQRTWERPWVSLTDDEMKLIDPDGYADGLPQQIQQALKEKNT